MMTVGRNIGYNRIWWLCLLRLSDGDVCNLAVCVAWFWLLFGMNDLVSLFGESMGIDSQS